MFLKIFLVVCAIGLWSCNISPSEDLIVGFPDPFLMNNGNRASSIMDWNERRGEIAQLAMDVQYGQLPDAPDSISAEMAGNTLTVNCTVQNNSISFSSVILYPEQGAAPYPAVITYGFSSMTALFLEMGVAVINFPNDDLAVQGGAHTRGQGKFYELHGSNHSSGAIMAWAWGVSRLIDALEILPQAEIDAGRLAVTGCSRNGKGSLAAGAFDVRVALTIVQESGSGGAASWRVSDRQQARGGNVQTLSQIVTENCWFRSNFGTWGSRVNDLPLDQHMVMGLVAPRGLLVIENTSMEWLGNESTWIASNLARAMWEAFGQREAMGFSQIGHGSHCSLPASQEPEVRAFVRRFLLDDPGANTNVFKSDGRFRFIASNWAEWEVPVF